jgi:hypothetical protein
LLLPAAQEEANCFLLLSLSTVCLSASLLPAILEREGFSCIEPGKDLGKTDRFLLRFSLVVFSVFNHVLSENLVHCTYLLGTLETMVLSWKYKVEP